jgi:hypothetical protein
VKLIVRISIALVAVAAAALSFQSLWRLGQLAGYRDLAWAFPLVVDLGAASSCAAWLHTKSRQALGMTWALLASSVLLNGTTHYLESTGTAPSWLLVVAVAAVPPTVLGLCVHLAVGLGTENAPISCREEDTEDDLAARARQIVAATPGIGRNTLARELSISTHRARGLLAEISANGDRSGSPSH